MNTLIQHVKVFIKLVTQTLRLMVGAGDYDAYVKHFHEHHPEQVVMSKEQYFLHQLYSRYPNKKGNINRCPC
jgi:uncharacterized short protein YbdD (DUF466 family)